MSKWEVPDNKDGCWIQGNFYYYPLLREITVLRNEVESLEDDDLVEEVSYLLEDDEMVDKIIFSFFTTRILLYHERERLIWFYVCCKMEDYLVITEEEVY